MTDNLPKLNLFSKITNNPSKSPNYSWMTLNDIFHSKMRDKMLINVLCYYVLLP